MSYNNTTSCTISTSISMDYLENPNPNFTLENIDPSYQPFELSDYLMLDNDFDEDSSSQSMASSEKVTGGSRPCDATSGNINIKCKSGVMKKKMEEGFRVAFRTKSEQEVMDDGFKWRKYGKKTVKSSPNPRNYYRCSSGGCQVKKRVERDRDDSSYVITTYEGVHNHQSPCIVYYNQLPHMVPNCWNLQPDSR